MKTTYKLFIYSGCLFLFFALFSGSLGKFIFTGLADNAADKYILKRSVVDSMDAKIDNALYIIKQIELKVEKLKTFFSSEKPDETKFQKTENHILRSSIFDTISYMFRIIFIVVFYITGFFLLLTGLVVKLVDRNVSLRKRIESLEKAVFRNELIQDNAY
ncbi:hypothetical protein BH10BAC5_BH10BAC5_28060 [soil metagenome]